MTYTNQPGDAPARDLDAELTEPVAATCDRPDLLDTSAEQSNPADRLGFEPFSYTERS